VLPQLVVVRAVQSRVLLRPVGEHEVAVSHRGVKKVSRGMRVDVLSQLDALVGHTSVDAISPAVLQAVPALLHAARKVRSASCRLAPKGPQLRGVSSGQARGVPAGVPQPLLLQVGS
jgi:hypothetical protein